MTGAMRVLGNNKTLPSPGAARSSPFSGFAPPFFFRKDKRQLSCDGLELPPSSHLLWLCVVLPSSNYFVVELFPVAARSAGGASHCIRSPPHPLEVTCTSLSTRPPNTTTTTTIISRSPGRLALDTRATRAHCSCCLPHSSVDPKPRAASVSAASRPVVAASGSHHVRSVRQPHSQPLHRSNLPTLPTLHTHLCRRPNRIIASFLRRPRPGAASPEILLNPGGFHGRRSPAWLP